MNPKPCIFVVDDDPLIRMLLCDQFSSERYTVYNFANGETCLQSLNLKPSIILLDIHMPGQSGLEVCRKLRATDNGDIHVMFISAHDELDTLIAAFAVGGNDFISKNVNQDVLLRKVELAIEAEEQKRQLQLQLSFAQKTAFTAISSLGETGIVLHFMRAAYFCYTLEDLGALLKETLKQFHINALIRLTDQDNICEFGSDRYCTPLEQSILSYVCKLGHLQRDDDRLIMNFPHITMLIMDLNTQDQESLGRLQDHLAMIAETTGSRIDAMHLHQQGQKQNQLRASEIKQLVHSLSEMKNNQEQAKANLRNLINQQESTLLHTLNNIALDPVQIRQLVEAINPLSETIQEFMGQDRYLSQQLNEIITQQQAILNTSQ